MKVLEIAVGAVFACPDQVLLSKNFHVRPGCRRKSLVRNSRVGGGVHILILTRGTSSISGVQDLVRPPTTWLFQNAHLFISLFVRNFGRVCSQFWLSVRNSVGGPFNTNSKRNPSLCWLGGGGGGGEVHQHCEQNFHEQTGVSYCWRGNYWIHVGFWVAFEPFKGLDGLDHSTSNVVSCFAAQAVACIGGAASASAWASRGWSACSATGRSAGRCFSPGHLRPVILKPVGRIFEISDSKPIRGKCGIAGSPSLPPEKQGSEEIPQSKNAENADTKTRENAESADDWL